MTVTQYVQTFVTHECRGWVSDRNYGLKHSYARAKFYVAALNPSIHDELLATLLINLVARQWVLFDQKIQRALKAEVVKNLPYYSDPSHFLLRPHSQQGYQGFDEGICMGMTTLLLSQKKALQPSTAKGRFLHGQYWLASAHRTHHFFHLEGKLFSKCPSSEKDAQIIKHLFCRLFGPSEWKEESERDDKFYSLFGRIVLSHYPSRQRLVLSHALAKQPNVSFWRMHHLEASKPLDFQDVWQAEKDNLFTCHVSWYDAKGGKLSHVIYFSPPIFVDPNDIDPSTNEPRIHTFPTKEAAFLCFSFYLLANYALEPDFNYYFYAIRRLS